MLLHVTDFDGNIVDSFGNKNQAIVRATHTRNKTDDSELLDITIATSEAEEFQEYRHILIQDENGLYRDFIINRSEKENNGYSLIEATASYLIEIGNSQSIPAGSYTKLTAKQALYEVIRGTGWETGTVEWAGEKTTSWTSERTPYEMLKQLCTTYDLELDFTYEVDDKGIVKKFVHMYKKKALFNGKEIKKGKDLISLKRVSDATELNTALIALGPERDDDTRLRIEVVDDTAQAQFGLTKRYIWGIYEPESEDSTMTVDRLKTLAKTELNKRKTIDVSYEVDALDIKNQFPHEITRFGDMVRIKDTDFTPALYAEAEVVGIEHDLVADYRTYTFGTPKEFKEEDLRKYFNERLAMIQQQMKDNNTNTNTIIETITSELDKVERKVHRGPEPPAEPEENQFWFDTSNPQVAVLREYVNGEWVNSTAETVTQIGGLTREQIIYRELKQTYASVFSEHARLQTLYNDLVNSEYLVNLELKAELETVYNNVLNAFTDGSTKLENIEEETATIGALMEVQEALVIYRNHVQEFYIIVNDVQKSIDERLKFLQAQYTEEKFNEAMQGVATAIGGTYNEETGELIADIPNNDMLEEMLTTIEQTINDLTVENQAKLQELQDGITQTNQRITSTEEELSAGITSVTQKVDGLKIGGRNLLLDSRNRKFLPNNAGKGTAIQNIDNSWTVTPDQDNAISIYLSLIKNVISINEVELNKDYIFSIDVSVSEDCDVSYYMMNVEEIKHTKIPLIANETTRLYLDFKRIDTTKNPAVILTLSKNDTQLKYDYPKLEEGNIATDWTPAPEDTDKQITDIKTTVSTQSADINILKDGIKLKADNTEVTKIYDQYLTPLQTQVNAQKATLDVLPSQIAAKVSQAQYDADINSVVGRLNTSETEQIQLSNQIADRVTLNEYQTTKEKIENLSVGGRNLLLDSRNKTIFKPNNAGLGTPTKNEDNSWTLTPDIDKTVSVYHFLQYEGKDDITSKPLILNDWYTISFEVMTDKDTTIEIGINSNGIARPNDKIEKYEYYDVKANKKTKIHFTFKWVNEEITFNIPIIIRIFGNNNIGTSLTYDYPKLEEGNIATDWTPAPEDITQEVDTKLSQRDTLIEQNGREIALRASQQEFNASKQTLSRVLAEIVTNTTSGITLSYDENGGIQNFTLGPNGTSIDTKKLTIEAGDVSLKDGVFTVNKVNTKNVTIPRKDGGVPTIINGIDKQISTVQGMEPGFMSTFYVGNNLFLTEIFKSGTWYGVFKRYANSSSQKFARVNAYYFQHTRRYLKFNYVVHVGKDADDRSNTPTGIYMRLREFGRDVGYRMDYLNLVATSQGGKTGIVEVSQTFDLGPPTGEPRAFYIHVKPNGEGIVGGSTGTDPRTWNKFSVCKFAFRPFELYG